MRRHSDYLQPCCCAGIRGQHCPAHVAKLSTLRGVDPAHGLRAAQEGATATRAHTCVAEANSIVMETKRVEPVRSLLADGGGGGG